MGEGLIGNTFNQANGETDHHWASNAPLSHRGSAQDPGPGVVGVLSPTFSGNTLRCTDLPAFALQCNGWLLSGSAPSNPPISYKGDVPV